MVPSPSHSLSAEHEALVRMALASLPDGSVSVLDRELRYLYVTGERLKQVGLEPAALLGKSVAEAHEPELVEQIVPLYRRVLEGERVSFEVPVNGRWLSLSAAPVRPTDGPVEGLVVIVLDISKRKEAEHSLVKSSHDISAIWESMSNGFIALDPDWRFVYVNAEGERVLQRERDELLGQSIWEAFPEAVHLPAFELYHRAVAEQVAVHFEAFYAPLDVWVEVRAYPSAAGLMVYFHDITERKYAEQVQAQSQRFLQSMLNSLSAHIAVLDEQGNVLGVNDAWQRFGSANGGDSRCGVGANYLEVCEQASGPWSAEAPPVAQAIREILAGEREGFHLEYPCHSPQRQCWFTLHITTFKADTVMRVVVAHEEITERKLAELELAQSEVKFRTIFESVQDAILLADDTGRYLEANPAASELLGMSRADILAHTVIDLAPPEARPAATALWQTFLREGKQSGEYELLRPDGSARLVEFRASANFLPGQHLSVLRDITERRQAERTESYFASIVQSTDDAIIGATLEGIITSWNGGALRMLGYSASEMIGQPFDRLVTPSDMTTYEHLKSEQIASGFNQLLEKPMLCKDGSTVDASIHSTLVRSAAGELLGVFIIARDITERKRAQEAQMHLATIVEASSDAIISKTLDGTITSWNRGATQMYGYHAAEAIGQPMGMLLPPAQRDEEQRILERLRRGEAVPPYDSQRLRKDGQLIDVSVSSSPISNAAGEVIGGSSIARDITAQKQAEAERERFFTLSLDMMCIVSAEGTLLRVNPAFERVLGYPPESLVGTRAFDLLHPDDVEVSLVALRQLIEGIPVVNLVNRWQCRDGSYKSIMWATAPYGRMMYAAGRDITAIRAAETMLAQSLAMLEATLESTADGILVVDGAGRISHFNQQFVDMWRIPQEVIASRDNDLTIAFVRDQLREPRHFEENTRALLASPEREGFDLLHFKDGRVYERYSKTLPKDGGGRVWSFRDITARERAARAQARLTMEVEQQRRRLDDILANVPGIVWESAVDPATGEQTMLYISDYVEAMLGYSKEEWAQSPSVGLSSMHPDDRESVFAQSEAIIRDSRAGVLRYRLRAKDGHTVWAETHMVVVHNDQGDTIGLRGVTMDISERMQAQELLRRTNEALEERVAERTAALKAAVQAAQAARQEAEQANRAKSDFLSRMSHELRTPLNAILGFGQILEIRGLPPKENEWVQQILKGGRHLLGLINEVLEIARIEAGHLSVSLEPIEVLPLLSEVLSLVQPLAAQRGIALLNAEADAPPTGWYIMADRQRLQQVLLNLLSNAIKYNREGGSVMLGLEGGTSESAQPMWRITVRDTGMGIPAQALSRIFLPFERLATEEQSRIEGTGIGLTLADRLTELMGGTLGVESEVGVGSTFWVELPMAESPSTHFAYKESEPARAVPSLLSISQSVTLLYIEDNTSNLRVMKSLLEEAPQVRLLTAMQGGLGIELARQHRPDLILLDLHLPDLSGSEVLQQLQSEPSTRAIPVVIVSADATFNQIERLLAAGASRYVTKPIDIKKLIGILEEILGG